MRRSPLTGVTNLLAFFGRYSMLVYILHQVIGALVIDPAMTASGAEAIETGPWFTFINLAVLGAIYALCYLAEMIKRRYPPRRTVLQVLFGK